MAAIYSLQCWPIEEPCFGMSSDCCFDFSIYSSEQFRNHASEMRGILNECIPTTRGRRDEYFRRTREFPNWLDYSKTADTRCLLRRLQ